MTDTFTPRSRNPALALADYAVANGFQVNWAEVYRLAAYCEENVWPAQDVIWGARRPARDESQP